MKIVMANDHGAVELKKRISKWLVENGHEVKNLGVDVEERVDYPDQAELAIKEFTRGGYDLGILLCGTGIGVSIAANRFKGIRCAVVHDSYTARMAKEHNDANFLAFGGRVEYVESPESMLETFFASKFEGGRHVARVAKLDKLG
jgi:ribose 5-phosphate isomerase B